MSDYNRKSSDRPSTYGDLSASPIFDRNNESGVDRPTSDPITTNSAVDYENDIYVFDTSNAVLSVDDFNNGYTGADFYMDATNNDSIHLAPNAPWYSSVWNRGWSDDRYDGPKIINPLELKTAWTKSSNGSNRSSFLVIDRPEIWSFYAQIYKSGSPTLSPSIAIMQFYWPKPGMQLALGATKNSSYWSGPEFLNPDGSSIEEEWDTQQYNYAYFIKSGNTYSTQFMVNNTSAVERATDSTDYTKITLLYFHPGGTATGIYASLIGRRVG